MRNKIVLNNRIKKSDGKQNIPVSNLTNGRAPSILKKTLPKIIFVSSFPPRECGIATYTQDLIMALNNKFHESFTLEVCAIESSHEKHAYGEEVKYILDTDQVQSFKTLAQNINENANIQLVMVQHEFGLFKNQEAAFQQFMQSVTKPIILGFHTVLPNPNASLKENVQQIASFAASIVVMTNSSAAILMKEYGIAKEKITVISHGTHLVTHLDKAILKHQYDLTGKKVLSTFGLLSSGKNIETTLRALPAIVKNNRKVVFLIIGKTHPSVMKQEGEKYRNMLESMVKELKLEEHVRFINKFVPLHELLEYLQLSDVYLFTSKDPNQAVSGTFSYALSCGCPIISTPIPHACEVLKDDAGIIIDFESPSQLAESVNCLLEDESLRLNISSNGLHRIASTAWENSAIAHAQLFERISDAKIKLYYSLPEINLHHVKKMTTDFGMIQFSKINQPDIDSGYTLDDNARALIAMCQHYEITKDASDLTYISTYLHFIKFCLQSEGYFLNYVDENKTFTPQNNTTNLADSNGRAIWSLGYLMSMSAILPKSFQYLEREAELIMDTALLNVNKIHSTRAMAFIIKGLYYRNTKQKSIHDMTLIKQLADRLVQMYKHESSKEWAWYESYLTYANSLLPEALLCAWLATGESSYKEIAKTSFDFLLSKIVRENKIKVISNKGWLHKGTEAVDKHLDQIGGEQPIDVAYTIIALGKFHEVFKDQQYMQIMHLSFNWFLGANHLHQIIYNPCTGGCYDGLEETNVNLNQGAESTVSYLMARLTFEGIHVPAPITMPSGITEIEKVILEPVLV